MPWRLAFSTGALSLVILSGLVVPLPIASAQSPIPIAILNGAGGGANDAPGFSPDSITVVIGVNNTVSWTNDDQVDHTVTSLSVPTGATPFDSGKLSPGEGMPWQTPRGENFTETFIVPGTYQYHCTLHAWMTGTIVVKAAATPAPEFPAASLAVVLFVAMVAAASMLPRVRPASLARSLGGTKASQAASSG
ncbi:MAG TPA: plastocyanin/azurin family copper-binding protein [Nitrososphaerales archaeon]|nr:plastocyanin/azurin family copper-binding protein [Nitrososphaerales archaeon]